MDLVKENKVKRLVIDECGKKVSHDFIEALNEKVEKMVWDACNRAGQNGRSIAMPKDL